MTILQQSTGWHTHDEFYDGTGQMFIDRDIFIRRVIFSDISE